MTGGVHLPGQIPRRSPTSPPRSSAKENYPAMTTDTVRFAGTAAALVLGPQVVLAHTAAMLALACALAGVSPDAATIEEVGYAFGTVYFAYLALLTVAWIVFSVGRRLQDRRS